MTKLCRVFLVVAALGAAPVYGQDTLTHGIRYRVDVGHMVYEGPGFRMERTAVEGGTELVLTTARGADPITITVVGATFRVERSGGSAVYTLESADNARALLAAPHVTAFLEAAALLESELDAKPLNPRVAAQQYIVGVALLLDGAIVAEIAGDGSALKNFRNRHLNEIRKRQLEMGRPPNLRPVAFFQFRDCVAEYERYLLAIDAKRTDCLKSANSGWYSAWQQAGYRLACEIEFTAATQAGIWQFIACSAIPKG